MLVSRLPPRIHAAPAGLYSCPYSYDTRPFVCRSARCGGARVSHTRCVKDVYGFPWPPPGLWEFFADLGSLASQIPAVKIPWIRPTATPPSASGGLGSETAMPSHLAPPGPHMVNLMRRMQALEEERKEVLGELAALGAPGADEDRRRRNRSNGMEDFDLVAMWTETSETLQGMIAEREAQLESAMARC